MAIVKKAHARRSPVTKAKTKKTAAKKTAATKASAGRAVGSRRSPQKKATQMLAGTTALFKNWRPKERLLFVTDVAGGTRKAADLLGVAPSQPSRWASGESVPGPNQARVLVDIDYMLAHVLLVWGDKEVARDWLTTPNSHLDGIRPVDWILLNGTTEVVDALRAEASGAYA